MGDFRKLEIWQLAKELAVYVYKITSRGDFVKDFDLRGQIRKAAVSTASNISEGEESGSNKQAVRYFNIAIGSSAEVQTQGEIAYAIGYLSEQELTELIERCEILSKKTKTLIKHRLK
ncbi:MAG: four helix bundle protein [Candidatus Cloacimonetes bacterium]|nr:four helix bundle protein [Candidatus Cloacimonadota bacterium]